MVCASLLQKAGIAPIMHVYIMNEHHLNEYAAYLKANPSVKIITINCTRQRKEPNEVERIRAAVAHLLSVRADLRIILQGLNVKDAKLFCEFNANLHYMVSTPTHNALMRKEALYDPRSVSISTLHGSDRGKGELAELNMLAYNAFFQNVCAVE